LKIRMQYGRPLPMREKCPQIMLPIRSAATYSMFAGLYLAPFGKQKNENEGHLASNCPWNIILWSPKYETAGTEGFALAHMGIQSLRNSPNNFCQKMRPISVLLRDRASANINLAPFATQASVKLREEYFDAIQQGHDPFAICKQGRYYNLFVREKSIPWDARFLRKFRNLSLEKLVLWTIILKRYRFQFLRNKDNHWKFTTLFVRRGSARPAPGIRLLG
jgi:hypothetical protein